MADPIASFSGVSSGIQYRDLVDQIIAAERFPADRARAQAKTLQNQLAALTSYRSLLGDFTAAAKRLRDGTALNIPGTSVTDPAGGKALSATPTKDSVPGVYQVEVTRLAQREKIVAGTAIGTGAALGLAGDFTVNGVRVDVVATDTLGDVRDKINKANTGAAPSGASATVLSVGGSAGRLSLTAANTGAAGIDLVDGSGGILAQLGFTPARTVTGAALTDGAGTAPATASTALTALGSGGASSGVKAGDTLTIAGTRADGSAVNVTFTVGASSTMQDLLDAINDPTTGFGGGTVPAGASIDRDGRLRLTDGAGGSSQLALSITAGNEGGGSLNFGPFTTGARALPSTAGSDAAFTVDGVKMTRTANSIGDALPGVTLDLVAVQPGSSEIRVERSVGSSRSAVQGFVDAYNKLVDFIQTQNTADTKAGTTPALYHDSVLSIPRRSLASTILQSVTGAASDLDSLRTAGISLGKDGKLTLDATTFDTAFKNRYEDLQTLFMERNSTSSDALRFVTSAAKAPGGDYAVAITTAAAQGAVTTSGFSGVYADDATPDVLTVADSATNGAVSVELSNGMTTAQIVDALNAAFAAPVKHKITSAATFAADAGGTAATSATAFGSLFSGGTSVGAAAGDTIEYSGKRADGSSFSGTFTIADPATTTLGDFTAQLQTQYGDGATVSIVDGHVVVEAAEGGTSSLDLTLSPKNQGGGTLSFGAWSLAKGHAGLSMTAEAVGNEVRIRHDLYGSAYGVTITQSGSSTAQLGLADGTAKGVDVAGTIGGQTAKGSGQQLVVDAGQPAAGLTVEYSGTTANASAGTVSLTVGAGALLERLANAWTATGDGLLANKESATNARITSLNDRADRVEARLEIRRQYLLKSFMAMEVAMGQLQNQTKSLAALAGGNNGSNS